MKGGVKFLVLMKYLQCGKQYHYCEGELWAWQQSLPSWRQLLKQMSRMFQVGDEEKWPDRQPPTNDNVEESVDEHTFIDKSQATKEKVLSKSTKVYGCQHFTKEFNVFEARGETTHNFDKIFQALRSAPPASVVAKRGFPASALFIAKLRTCCDPSSDCLCFHWLPEYR